MNDSISPLKAMEIMREFSRQNIPFTMKYISLNESEKSSKGITEEKNVLLTAGYRRSQSDKSNILTSFVRLDTNENRQFYWPLLCELNGRKIQP